MHRSGFNHAFDFSSIAAVNNNANVVIRIEWISAATGPGTSGRVDDVLVTAVPEAGAGWIGAIAAALMIWSVAAGSSGVRTSKLV
jgi:hypothetical protein